MRTCQRSLSVLAVTILLSNLTFAKTDIHDWRNVRILELGSTIVVKTKQGEKYEGTLDYAGLDSISIVVKVPRVMRQIIKVPKDDVKEVRTKLSRIATAEKTGSIFFVKHLCRRFCFCFYGNSGKSCSLQ